MTEDVASRLGRALAFVLLWLVGWLLLIPLGMFRRVVLDRARAVPDRHRHRHDRRRRAAGAGVRPHERPLMSDRTAPGGLAGRDGRQAPAPQGRAPARPHHRHAPPPPRALGLVVVHLAAESGAARRPAPGATPMAPPIAPALRLREAEQPDGAAMSKPRTLIAGYCALHGM